MSLLRETQQSSKPPSAAIDSDTFLKLLLYLWRGIGRTKDPDEITVQCWFDNLKDLTREQLFRGIQEFIKGHSAEFVSVQKIRELSGAQSAADEASTLAWSALLAAIKFYGGYQTPKWDRPDAARITQAISHLGGWVRLCDTESDELHKWTRQAFCKAYNAIPATAEQARLTNLIAIENARTGQTQAAESVQRLIEQRCVAMIEVK
jgi:hypothetical protein